MPFYHAVQATPYVKAVIGKYHLSDPTPILTALAHAWTNCCFVEDTGDVCFYKRANEY